MEKEGFKRGMNECVGNKYDCWQTTTVKILQDSTVKCSARLPSTRISYSRRSEPMAKSFYLLK